MGDDGRRLDVGIRKRMVRESCDESSNCFLIVVSLRLGWLFERYFICFSFQRETFGFYILYNINQ